MKNFVVNYYDGGTTNIENKLEEKTRWYDVGTKVLFIKMISTPPQSIAIG